MSACTSGGRAERKRKREREREREREKEKEKEKKYVGFDLKNHEIKT